ncbi:MBL fold metallo-hydrolase [Pseudarthrobacter sp. S9]|uniref:MBL fold metallo-hydrolase n=1 Tax=Pseudarthrobacter sp. S9 TaxID=3418421 RepID=UPI003D07A323
MTAPLTLAIFTAPAQPVNIPMPAPEGGWTWPSTSVTLVSGEREAILVDTVPGVADSQRLADWIEASGKELTSIYITHGHFDHFLGAAALVQRFPKARVLATRPTVDLIAEEAETRKELANYTPMFVQEIGSEIVVPEAVVNGRIELEGHEILAVPTGQSDVSDSSYVHIPELKAVIVGDIAYGDVHPTLVDSTPETRRNWIKTLEAIQLLKPETVVPAHRSAESALGGEVLDATIAYVRDANELLATNPTAEEFTTKMLAAHPDRINLSTLLFGTALLGLRQA